MKGDGREYSLNLYPNKPLVAFTYRATVQTKKDEWIEVKFPLDKFEATSFSEYDFHLASNAADPR